MEFREEVAADALRTIPSNVSRVVLAEARPTKQELPSDVALI